jgi:hypothetical protein
MRKNNQQILRTPPLSKNTYSILHDSVDVDAVISPEYFTDPSLRPVFDILLNVHKGADNFQCESVYTDCDTSTEVVDRLQRSITWKGKYLLVPTSCGGGNAWRCDIMHVYCIVDNRLKNVGEASIDTNGEHDDGRFVDIYDKLESNNLTSHAEAPGFSIILYDSNGTFAANLTETWEENQSRYSENKSILESLSNKKNPQLIEDYEKLPPLVFNSVLCKYCQRQDELKLWNTLSSRLIDEDAKILLDSMLTLVVPGELP